MDVQPTGITDDLYSFIENGGSLFAAGENGTIIRSDDLGVTWTRLVTGTTETIRCIRSSAISGTLMLAVGDNGTVLRTSNFGDDWCTLDPETTANLLSIFMVNTNEMIIGGENGVLVYTNTGGGNCDDIVPVEPSPQPGVLTPPTIVLSAPRPNPFGDATTVSFGVPLALDGSRARVTVFDVAGRAVRHLVDTAARPGGYTVAWDGADDAGASVANGTYFVRLTAGRETAHQRVTVVR